MIEYAIDHRRDHEGPGDFLFFDQAEHFRRIKSRHDRDPRTHCEGSLDKKARRMGDWTVYQEVIISRDLCRHHVAHEVHPHRRHMMHDALGPAGRAAGEPDEMRIVRREVGAGRRRLGCSL